jgi:hypothetical protein
LARQHRDFPVSHDLEIISIELMEKAAQLERYLAGDSRRVISRRQNTRGGIFSPVQYYATKTAWD